MAYSDIVNDDTMISPTIIVYYKYKGDFFNILENDNLFHFYYSLKRENRLLTIYPSEQAVDFWFLPLFLSSKDYCIHSFWSQNTENKKNRP